MFGTDRKFSPRLDGVGRGLWWVMAAMLALGVRAETIRVWSHQGQEAESRAMREIVAAFNAAEENRARGWTVELTFFPDFQYTEKLAVAAAGRDLPDAFDLDGPLVARFVKAGLLAEIGGVFSQEELEDFLPTIRAQGTIGGRLYALGNFDSALVLYYDRELLASAGVAVPEGGRGWTWDEFVAACEKVMASGVEPVALHMNESADEWFTYAFSPVVWSGGGDVMVPSETEGEIRRIDVGLGLTYFLNQHVGLDFLLNYAHTRSDYEYGNNQWEIQKYGAFSAGLGLSVFLSRGE